MNNVNLTGRLTRDVELRVNLSGSRVVNFTIAVDDYFKEDRKTYFIRVVAWNNDADFLNKYAHKGDKVAVDGRLTQRTYEYNGENREAVEVVANHIELMTPPAKVEPKPEKVIEARPFVPEVDDDLPF